MKKVYEAVGICPSCGQKTFRVEVFQYDMSVEGPSVLVVGKCDSCGFKTADVYPLEMKGEKELELKTDEPGLRTVLYVPGNTTVELPTLGIEVNLTPSFRGRITTLEGLLYIVSEGSREAEEKIRGALERGEVFSVKIRNPDGALKILHRDEP